MFRRREFLGTNEYDVADILEKFLKKEKNSKDMRRDETYSIKHFLSIKKS